MNRFFPDAAAGHRFLEKLRRTRAKEARRHNNPAPRTRFAPPEGHPSFRPDLTQAGLDPGFSLSDSVVNYPSFDKTGTLSTVSNSASG
jgi:hypothetical protein